MLNNHRVYARAPSMGGIIGSGTEILSPGGSAGSGNCRIEPLQESRGLALKPSLSYGNALPAAEIKDSQLGPVPQLQLFQNRADIIANRTLA